MEYNVASIRDETEMARVQHQLVVVWKSVGAKVWVLKVVTHAIGLIDPGARVSLILHFIKESVDKDL